MIINLMITISDHHLFIKEVLILDFALLNLKFLLKIQLMIEICHFTLRIKHFLAIMLIT